MGDLWQTFSTHTGRRTLKWPHYFPVYEKHLERFRNTACTILEIGCARGGSLQLWKGFLGPLAKIAAIDINPECLYNVESQVTVYIGNQGDRVFLGQVFDDFGVPDIVIDDGSHVQSDIDNSFNFFFPRMSKNGVYIVEDLMTAYDPKFGGGRLKSGSFIEFSKSLVDSLNGYHWHASDTDVDVFTTAMQSMHFYDGMVVFEKGDHPRPAECVCVGRVGPPCHKTDLPEKAP